MNQQKNKLILTPSSLANLNYKQKIINHNKKTRRKEIKNTEERFMTTLVKLGVVNQEEKEYWDRFKDDIKILSHK